MKVCDVVLNSIWYDPRVRKQISEYKNQGIDVYCVGLKCNRYDKEKIEKIKCPVKIVSLNEKYSGKQRSVLNKIKGEMVTVKEIEKAIVSIKPDIIHANDLNALIPAYKASKKLGCKLIYDSHEIFVENFFYGKKILYSLYLKAQEKYICKRVDKMVCVSNAAGDYFSKEYKIPKPTIITNCSLKSEIYYSKEKNTGFEVLNHGQFYSGRGYDLMVESIPLLKEFSDIKLAIRGMGQLENELKKRAKELGDENFRFYPPVLVEDLISSASKSMVGVAITEAICLNFKLSVSNKLFEYASAGLPVIMSDIPEHRYLNEKYKFGVILQNNTPDDFAAAVKKLYCDKEFYNMCAENAKIMSNELNWENEFGKLIEIEKALIK